MAQPVAFVIGNLFETFDLAAISVYELALRSTGRIDRDRNKQTHRR